MLSAGERRAYTANDIFRDPGWRKRDADGALRVSVEDAEALGPGRRRPRARHHRGAAAPRRRVEISEAMLPGHASLPNGFGLDYIDDDGADARPRRGAELRSPPSDWRDAYAGTPWHKHVPARIEAVSVA